MRACHPTVDDDVIREGVGIHYEIYGDGSPSILLLPTWSIIHSRQWKMQIPYLARHFQVVTLDPRGNGRSDRPAEPAAYDEREFAHDALAVLDAVGIDQALIVGFSRGAQRGLLLAAEYPERVSGAVFIGPGVPIGPVPPRESKVDDFSKRRDTYVGWQKYNRHYWVSDYQGFLEFFFGELYNEPHSTKQREDAVGWGLETEPMTLVATHLGPKVKADELGSLAARVSCPVLVIHGTDDAIRPHASGLEFANLLGGELVSLVGCGHAPHGRDPVRVNLLIKQFADRIGR